MDLFDFNADRQTRAHRPLAERMRPRRLDDFMGQSHITGPGALLRGAIESNRLFSVILWGPPGCGKTTLAHLLANETDSCFQSFSAVLSGIKDIRKVIDEARHQKQFNHRRMLLFVDEIHRFNKAQQDAFLQHVETGLITLIGATTENPSFEVISALLSRCRVLTLKPLAAETIQSILQRALEDTENGLGSRQLTIEPQALRDLSEWADGDARTALTGLELAANAARAENSPITAKALATWLQRKSLRYDKSGEEHFNLISALHKSMRGSDPDAALYWLERMLTAGEDPLYIVRRMVRFASEDIGNADPIALSVALNAMQAYRFLGSPEGDLALSQAAVYLATAPKSNRIYTAAKQAKALIKKTGSLEAPLHIRNAPTQLMRDIGYGAGYQYAHDSPDAYVAQQYLPEEIESERFYHPSERGYEKTIKQRMAYWNELKNRS